MWKYLIKLKSEFKKKNSLLTPYKSIKDNVNDDV